MKRSVKYEGNLKLSEELQLPCYVLDDGTRILSGRGMQNALRKIPPNEEKNENQKGGGELTRFTWKLV